MRKTNYYFNFYFIEIILKTPRIFRLQANQNKFM